MRYDKPPTDKSETAEKHDDEDEETDKGTQSSTQLTEGWTSWYPQEWIGWVMFGLPSENPTDLWVNQPISSGPSTRNLMDEEKGTKKPAGRNVQREKYSFESVSTKLSVDNNTMRAQHLMQVNEELEHTRSSRDLKIIEMMLRRAKTEASKVNCICFCSSDMIDVQQL